MRFKCKCLATALAVRSKLYTFDLRSKILTFGKTKEKGTFLLFFAHLIVPLHTDKNQKCNKKVAKYMVQTSIQSTVNKIEMRLRGKGVVRWSFGKTMKTTGLNTEVGVRSITKKEITRFIQKMTMRGDL
mgnify:CR=1 FL=1